MVQPFLLCGELWYFGHNLGLLVRSNLVHYTME
eukprot:SAG31_NODE_32873_length_350_cov_1.800797_1_plen_32_part_10